MHRHHHGASKHRLLDMHDPISNHRPNPIDTRFSLTCEPQESLFTAQHATVSPCAHAWKTCEPSEFINYSASENVHLVNDYEADAKFKDNDRYVVDQLTFDLTESGILADSDVITDLYLQITPISPDVSQTTLTLSVPELSSIIDRVQFVVDGQIILEQSVASMLDINTRGEDTMLASSNLLHLPFWFCRYAKEAFLVSRLPAGRQTSIQVRLRSVCIKQSKEKLLPPESTNVVYSVCPYVFFPNPALFNNQLEALTIIDRIAAAYIETPATESIPLVTFSETSDEEIRLYGFGPTSITTRLSTYINTKQTHVDLAAEIFMAGLVGPEELVNARRLQVFSYFSIDKLNRRVGAGLYPHVIQYNDVIRCLLFGIFHGAYLTLFGKSLEYTPTPRRVYTVGDWSSPLFALSSNAPFVPTAAAPPIREKMHLLALFADVYAWFNCVLKICADAIRGAIASLELADLDEKFTMLQLSLLFDDAITRSNQILTILSRWDHETHVEVLEDIQAEISGFEQDVVRNFLRDRGELLRRATEYIANKPTDIEDIDITARYEEYIMSIIDTFFVDVAEYSSPSSTATVSSVPVDDTDFIIVEIIREGPATSQREFELDSMVLYSRVLNLLLSNTTYSSTFDSTVDELFAGMVDGETFGHLIKSMKRELAVEKINRNIPDITPTYTTSAIPIRYNYTLLVETATVTDYEREAWLTNPASRFQVVEQVSEVSHVTSTRKHNIALDLRSGIKLNSTSSAIGVKEIYARPSLLDGIALHTSVLKINDRICLDTTKAQLTSGTVDRYLRQLLTDTTEQESECAYIPFVRSPLGNGITLNPQAYADAINFASVLQASVSFSASLKKYPRAGNSTFSLLKFWYDGDTSEELNSRLPAIPIQVVYVYYNLYDYNNACLVYR